MKLEQKTNEVNNSQTENDNKIVSNEIGEMAFEVLPREKGDTSTFCLVNYMK